MAIAKPQKPLMVNEQEIYPLTSADQVVMADGTRMPNHGLVSIDDPEFSEDVVPVGIDADTLGGELPKYYAKTIPTEAWCLCCFPADHITVSNGSIWPMSIYAQNNFNTYWELSGEGTLICKKSHVALISGQYYVYTGFTTTCNLYGMLRKNESVLSRSQISPSKASPYETVNFSPIPATFSVGDVLSVYFSNYEGGKIKNYTSTSYILVKTLYDIEEVAE